MNARRLIPIALAALAIAVTYIAMVRNQFFASNSSDHKENASRKTKAIAPTVKPAPSYPPIDAAFAKFQTGDYEAAVRLLRAQHIKEPDNERVTQNLATALFALGMQRLKEMRPSVAEDLFEESAELGHSGAATALASMRVKSGQIDSALAALERIYDARKDPEALRALVDLALSREDLNRADYYLSRGENDLSAQGDDPKTNPLASFLEERRKRLKLRRLFVDQSTTLDLGRAQVAFLKDEMRGTAEVVLQTLADSIEQLSQRFVQPPDGQRFRALVLSQETFQGNTGAPPWAQAIFDGVLRIQVPSGRPDKRTFDRAAAVTRHESIHAYLYYLCGDAMPSWLGEGLAQMHEGRPLSQSVAALRIKLGRTLPLTTSTDPWFDRPFVEAPSKAIDELYARSLLLLTGIEKSKGSQIWKSMITRVCVDKDSFATASLDLLGSSSGLTLWQENYPILSEIFLARR